MIYRVQCSFETQFIQYILSYFIIAKSPFVYNFGQLPPLGRPQAALRSFLLPCPEILQLFRTRDLGENGHTLQSGDSNE